ncbi:insulinase family protein [Terriglobus albidus]|uniref:Insulinase family protein n=1 Tax=Terriglobus albidus TaxID=1592106 RepID=A0A5B9EDD3_9BACT|nr:pitrilysin family protein [Terriglobus albidus]QEE29729.1 insulinase family protein [Terriglobus albidus]
MKEQHLSLDITLAENSTTATSGHPARNIRKTRLPNGLLVLTERMPHLRSVSMGVWVGTGSRDEAPELNGISHFVEHMVFKGTTSRSAQQIAREVDAIGGNLDAFTGKETVCFNIKVLDSNIAAAMDVLADLVLHPTFTPDDIVREQSVILEEIKMDEDNPDYLVHELFTQNFWKDDALGRPILGTKKTVSSFRQQTVFDFYAGHFTAANMVFSAAGNLDHHTFVALVEQHFSGLSATSSALPGRACPRAQHHLTLRNKKSLEQVQICLGTAAPAVASQLRYPVYLLNTILGGGMSSRLFQTIREDRGLAYSIYSEMNPFRDTGSLCVYAGTAPEKAKEAILLTVSELSRLKQELVTEDELERAKNQLKGNIVLGLESSSSRMANLARQQMYFDRFFTVDEIIDQVEAVTREDLQVLAQELFHPDSLALTLLGNLDGIDIQRSDLAC